MDDATNGKAIDKIMVIRKGGSTPETVNQTQFLQWLGLAVYADLTAANTALASGSIFYNTALGKLDITTA
jgi:hypothetical protein